MDSSTLRAIFCMTVLLVCNLNSFENIWKLFFYSTYQNLFVYGLLILCRISYLLGGLIIVACFVSELCGTFERKMILSPRKVMLEMSSYIPNFSLTSQQVSSHFPGVTRLIRCYFFLLFWSFLFFSHTGCCWSVPSSSLFFKRRIFRILCPCSTSSFSGPWLVCQSSPSKAKKSSEWAGKMAEALFWTFRWDHRYHLNLSKLCISGSCASSKHLNWSWRMWTSFFYILLNTWWHRTHHRRNGCSILLSF